MSKNARERLSFFTRIDQHVVRALQRGDESVDVTDLDLTKSQVKKLLDVVNVSQLLQSESTSASVTSNEQDASTAVLEPEEMPCPTRLSGLRLVMFVFCLMGFPIGLIAGALLSSIPWIVGGVLFSLFCGWICLGLQFKQVDQFGDWSKLRERYPTDYASIATATQLLYVFSFLFLLLIPLLLFSTWSGKVEGDSPSLSLPFFPALRQFAIVVCAIAVLIAVHYGKSRFYTVRGWCVINLPAMLCVFLYVFSKKKKEGIDPSDAERSVADPDRNPFFMHGRYLMGAIVAVVLASNFAYVELLEKISERMDDVPRRAGQIIIIAKAISGNRYPLLIVGNILCCYFVYQYSHRLCVSFKLARPTWKASAITCLVALFVFAVNLVAWALSG